MQLTFLATWTFEDFKEAIIEDVGSPPISDINLKVPLKNYLCFILPLLSEFIASEKSEYVVMRSILIYGSIELEVFVI